MVEESPPRPATSPMFYMILMMGFMFIIVFVPEIREAIGGALGFVLQPLIGFNYQYPVITVLIAGLLTTILSTVIRHFMTDWVKMAKTQEVQKALTKDLRQAQKDNNLYKMKKLQELQTERMAQQSSTMVEQMKPMMVTMFVFIGIFTWLREFLYALESFEFASFGWNSQFHFFDSFIIFPNYILLYMLVSISFGQVLQKGLKYYSFKKRLEELEV